MEFSTIKTEASEEQQMLAEVHLNVENDDQRRGFQELELNVRAHRDRRGQLTEDLDKERILVRSERNKAKVTKKLIREIKRKILLE